MEDEIKNMPFDIGKLLSGIGGVISLGNIASGLSGISDTTDMQGSIDSINQIGSTQYNSFEQLGSAYDRIAQLPLKFNYRDIRGQSDGQKVGGVLSSALTGASAGSAFGPLGAATGAVWGIGSGIVGMLSGNRKARDEKARLEQQAFVANDNARMNLSATNDAIMDYNFRSGVAHRADNGGKINRENLSLQEFASRVMKRPRVNYRSNLTGIISMKGDGGTIIRIQR